jgi:hypothetical protein
MIDTNASGKGLIQHPQDVMRAYQRFNDIPQDLRSEEHLLAWLHTAHGTLVDIPLALVTDKMRSAFIQMTGVFGPIKASDTPNYQALALVAIDKTPMLIMSTDQSVLTEAFLLEVIGTSSMGLMVLSIILQKWDERFLHGFTQRVMDCALPRSLSIAAKIASRARPSNNEIPQSIRDMVTDDHLRKAMMAEPSQMFFLKRMGKLDLLSQAISDGYWPASEEWFNHNFTEMTPEKPPLNVAIAKWKKECELDDRFIDKKNRLVFWEATILSHPIDEVLGFISSNLDLAPLIKEFYGTEQLMPFLRSHPAIKGLVLEQAIGL